MLFDVDPRMGPLDGGNVVTVSGTNFQETGQILCSFNDNVVKGKLTSYGKI